MPYAIAPAILTTLYNEPISYEATPYQQQIDGGVEQTGTEGIINVVGSTRNLKMVVGGTVNYNTIYNFLTNLKGKPFRWQGLVYRVESEGWDSLGRHHFELSLSLKQVFAPER